MRAGVFAGRQDFLPELLFWLFFGQRSKYRLRSNGKPDGVNDMHSVGGVSGMKSRTRSMDIRMKPAQDNGHTGSIPSQTCSNPAT